jgi:hypothetical protein
MLCIIDFSLIKVTAEDREDLLNQSAARIRKAAQKKKAQEQEQNDFEDSDGEHSLVLLCSCTEINVDDELEAGDLNDDDDELSDAESLVSTLLFSCG